MPEEQILSNISSISELRFSPLDESALKVLKQQTYGLATWFALAERMAPVVRSIQCGQQLPLRRIKYNIRTLSQEKHAARWTRLNDLGLESSIFCMVAISGLSSLPTGEFDSLLANVNQYISTQQISLHWVYAEDVKKSLGEINTAPVTAPFLKSKLMWLIAKYNQHTK